MVGFNFSGTNNILIRIFFYKITNSGSARTGSEPSEGAVGRLRMVEDF
jgi:hypothetical protein